ncbi:hypothetical protein CJ030_MR8G019531 [Morella rubra]|uniref:Uncharacterized protein n=1 Tax=Morella rubra TaxID=262757 RepID=A0A6A1UQ51_9ROSI|nr:hypothetical protein CJ030_MR8G019531 [Morella rubra]
MKMNPGHYVALLISTTLCPARNDKEDRPLKNENDKNRVRLTKIKLLRPTDTLVLGQVYRLITTQEVMKGLWAKKQAKMKKSQSESAEKPDSLPETAARRSQPEEDNHAIRHDERHRSRTTVSTTPATARPRTWQPSLQSISEAGS